jgi:hypothetical protein
MHFRASGVCLNSKYYLALFKKFKISSEPHFKKKWHIPKFAKYPNSKFFLIRMATYVPISHLSFLPLSFYIPSCGHLSRKATSSHALNLGRIAWFLGQFICLFLLGMEREPPMHSFGTCASHLSLPLTSGLASGHPRPCAFLNPYFTWHPLPSQP